MPKKLPLDDAPETVAFSAIVKVLQMDKTLKRINTKWGVWDGSSDDLREISASMCPYIELSPSPSETRWSEADQHRSTFDVDILLTVEGTCAADLLNLWGAVRRALFPLPGSAERDAVEAFLDTKCSTMTITGQPFQVVPVPGAVRMLQGEGTLRVLMNVNT